MHEHIDSPAPVNPTPSDDPVLVAEATRHVDDPSWSVTATASKIPAMLGYSEYDSPKSIWLKMKHRDRFPRSKGNNATRRGSILEAGYLDMWFQDNPRYQRIHGGEHTYTRDDLGYLAAATPDDAALDTETGLIYGIENKTIGPYAKILKEFSEEWTDEVPRKYLVQCVWQNIIAGFAGTLLIRNGPLIDDQITYLIGRNDAVEDAVLKRVRSFMYSVELGIEPANDTRAETYDAMRMAYWEILSDGDPGAEWEIHPQLALDFIEALHDLEDAEGRINLAKSELIKAMGKARKAIVPGQARVSEKTGKALKTYPVVIATRKAAPNGGSSVTKPRTMPDLDYLRSLVAGYQEKEISA